MVVLAVVAGVVVLAVVAWSAVVAVVAAVVLPASVAWSVDANDAGKSSQGECISSSQSDMSTGLR